MNPIIKLIRPINCLMSSLSIPIVMITLFGLDIDHSNLLVSVVGMLTVFFFTAGGNILNDYMDRKTDEINHPDRPIPSGSIKPKTALVLSGVMFSFSVILPFSLRLFLPITIVILGVILMMAYEFRLKKKGLAGNLTVSILTGMLFLFGGAIYEEIYLPALLGSLALLSTVSREIMKDIQDIKGDLDRNTFPMKVGPELAKRTAFVFVVLAVVLSPFPYILGFLPLTYLLIVIFADIIFIYSLLLLESAEKTQKYIKLAMAVALVAFLIGGLT